MQGYFDIHSHILPGVDDGAKDMDETRRMLLIAYEEGIRIIVATPHYIAGRKNIMVERLMLIYEEVNQIARNASKEFRIILGNELFYNLNLVDALKNGEALTIDGTRYILLEFHLSASFRDIWEGVNHCIFAGYIPILAHAERYRCLVNEYDLVGELIRSGAYIQLNLSCIKGRALDDKVKFSQKLLKRGWVHFLGTDTHNAFERAPRAKEAVTFLNKKYGEQIVKKLLWENPMTMIEDKHL